MALLLLLLHQHGELKPTTKRKSSGNLQLTVVIFGWVWYWLGWVCPIGEPGSCKRLNWHGGVGRVSDGSLNQTTNARVVGDYRPAPPYTQWTVINARWYPLVSKLAKILFSRKFLSLSHLLGIEGGELSLADQLLPSPLAAVHQPHHQHHHQHHQQHGRLWGVHAGHHELVRFFVKPLVVQSHHSTVPMSTPSRSTYF